MVPARHATCGATGRWRVALGAVLGLLVALGVAAPAAAGTVGGDRSHAAPAYTLRASAHPAHDVADAPPRHAATRHAAAPRTGPDPVVAEAGGARFTGWVGRAATALGSDLAPVGAPLRHPSRAPPVAVVS